MEEKQISINTMIILLFLILTLLFISIYTSLAVFKKSYEQKEIVSIKVKDITPNIELEESYENVILNEDNHSLEITASKNKKTFVNIKLKNYTNINVKYKLFYINNNNLSELDSVKVSSRSDGKSTDVIEKNNIKNIRIGLNNQTEQELKFVIGVQGGYETNDIILEDGKTELGIMDEYLDEAILVDNEIQDKLPTYTTDSSDRGLFKLQDDIALNKAGEIDKDIYYFRGSVDNNYVSFGNFVKEDYNNKIGEGMIWRIIRINSDKSVELILESQISKKIMWDDTGEGTGTRPDYVHSDNTPSNIKRLIDTWYNDTFINDSAVEVNKKI